MRTRRHFRQFWPVKVSVAGLLKGRTRRHRPSQNGNGAMSGSTQARRAVGENSAASV